MSAAQLFQSAWYNSCCPSVSRCSHKCCSNFSECRPCLLLNCFRVHGKTAALFFWMQGTAVAPLYQGACQRMQRKTTTAPLFRGADTNAALLFRNAGHNFCSISKCICTTAALLFRMQGTVSAPVFQHVTTAALLFLNARHSFCSYVSA